MTSLSPEFSAPSLMILQIGAIYADCFSSQTWWPVWFEYAHQHSIGRNDVGGERERERILMSHIRCNLINVRMSKRVEWKPSVNSIKSIYLSVSHFLIFIYSYENIVPSLMIFALKVWMFGFIEIDWKLKLFVPVGWLHKIFCLAS